MSIVLSWQVLELPRLRGCVLNLSQPGGARFFLGFSSHHVGDMNGADNQGDPGAVRKPVVEVWSHKLAFERINSMIKTGSPTKHICSNALCDLSSQYI